MQTTPTVTPDGEFDFDAYCTANDIPTHIAREYLTGLNGLSERWDIYLHAPDEYAPTGRLYIEHETYNEYTQVVIDTTALDDNPERTYAVHHPMETDILTHADGVSFRVAFANAIHVANNERDRQATVPTTTSLRERVTNAVRAVTQ